MTARTRDAARRPAEPSVTEARAGVVAPPIGPVPLKAASSASTCPPPARPLLCELPLETDSAPPADPGNDTLPPDRLQSRSGSEPGNVVVDLPAPRITSNVEADGDARVASAARPTPDAVEAIAQRPCPAPRAPARARGPQAGGGGTVSRDPGALQRPCARNPGTSARQPEPPDVVVILDPPGPEEVEAIAQRLAALLLGGALTLPRKDGILLKRNDPAPMRRPGSDRGK